EVIPAKRPKPQPAKQPPHPWTEPDSSWTGAAEKQMRQLIPHLHEILPIVLRESKLPEYAAVTDLLQLPPLEIKGGSDKGQSSAFRERWRESNAALAIRSCEMYEAAGVLWWLHTFPQENDAQTQHMQWDDVVAYSDRLCQLVKGKVVTTSLIPCYVWAQDADKLELESSFPSGLNVVGPALLPLWGLLLALMREVTRAQGSRDFGMVRLLLEAARSLPLRLAILHSKAELARLSITFSHDNRINLAMSDTFVTWLPKYCLAMQDFTGKVGEIQTYLSQKGIKFEGKDLNENVVRAARLGQQYLLSDSVQEAIAELQRKHGRAALTEHYTSLLRLMLAMQSVLKKLGMEPSSEALAWVIDYTCLALDQNWISLASLKKSDSWGDSKSTTTLTWGQATILKYAAVHHVKSIIDALTEDVNARKELHDAMDFFVSVQLFGKRMVASSGQSEEKDDQAGTAMDSMSSFARSLAEWLHALLACDLEEEFQSLWLQAGSDAFQKALKDITSPPEDSGEWGKYVAKFMSEMELMHETATMAAT
ncbi:unnamed protein product, partial [Effrenium voratum]